MEKRIFQVAGVRIFIVIALLSSLCPAAVATDIELLNELGSSEPGYILHVRDILTTVGASTKRFSLRPGQRVKLAQQPVKKFTLLRDFGNYSKVYEVSCPTSDSSSVTLKLIDVHTNRMRGGCKLTRKGTYRPASGTQWE